MGSYGEKKGPLLSIYLLSSGKKGKEGREKSTKDREKTARRGHLPPLYASPGNPYEILAII